jgi:hypothetical protein
MSRPRGAASGGARLTFSEISRLTGIPRSTVFADYQRIEERLVVAWIILSRKKERPAKKLAAA